MTHPKTALLVIDVQKIYTNPESALYCQDSGQTIHNINKLIDHAAANQNPVIYVRHVHTKDGSDLGHMFDFAGPVEDFNFKAGSLEAEYADGIKYIPNSKEFSKSRYSCFKTTDLESHLRKQGIERVVICGFMTNFCCESTAREAHDLDFLVTFVTDATGCPDLDAMSQPQIRAAVSAFLAAGFATVLDTEDYLTSGKRTAA